jgi:DNA-binding HxlR family transcriptional regulator
MAALDLLGRRWSLRVLWELRSGPVGARNLLSACDGLSSSVLYDRLRELTVAGLVSQGQDDRYELTPIGTELRQALQPLDSWSRQWAGTQR